MSSIGKGFEKWSEMTNFLSAPPAPPKKIIQNKNKTKKQKQTIEIKQERIITSCIIRHTVRKHIDEARRMTRTCQLLHTGGNSTKLPSSRWRRRGRSLWEVFACSCFSVTTDLSQIYNRETRRHGTHCIKTTDSYLFSFLYNNPRKIRRETTVGKFVPNNGRR